MGHFFVLHGLFKPESLFPEKNFPCGKKKCPWTKFAPKCLRLYHVSTIFIPQLAIVTLMRSPEAISLQHLILLEIWVHAPVFVRGQGMMIILEVRIYPRYTTVQQHKQEMIFIYLIPLWCNVTVTLTSTERIRVNKMITTILSIRKI